MGLCVSFSISLSHEEKSPNFLPSSQFEPCDFSPRIREKDGQGGAAAMTVSMPFDCHVLIRVAMSAGLSARKSPRSSAFGHNLETRLRQSSLVSQAMWW